MKRIRITYEILTPESIEAGDAAEHGWIDEEGVDMSPDECDIDDDVTAIDKAIDFLHSEGAIHPSDSCCARWFTAYEHNDGTTRFYEDGEIENRSFHLVDEDWTDDERQEIHNIIVK